MRPLPKVRDLALTVSQTLTDVRGVSFADIGPMKRTLNDPTPPDAVGSAAGVGERVVFKPPTWWRGFLIAAALMFGSMAALIPIVALLDADLQTSPLVTWSSSYLPALRSTRRSRR